nr:AraC family transcriptional regulator ligand-binding domain-containing protein [Rhodococcus sp. PvR099]
MRGLRGQDGGRTERVDSRSRGFGRQGRARRPERDRAHLRHMRVHNEAIRIRLVELNGLASLHIEPAPGMTLGRQSIELVIASLARILSAFLPEDWRPLSTCFVHDAPPTLEVHHRAFGTDIAFEQDFNGLVLYSSDLDSINPLSDPMFKPYARQYLDLLAPPEDASVVGRVRGIIEALLPGGSCTAARIARATRPLSIRCAQTSRAGTSRAVIGT